MFRDRSFNVDEPEPWNSSTLVRDLDLAPLINAMANGDDFVKKVARKVLLLGVSSMDDILYRQEALRDALANQETIYSVYKVLSQTVKRAKEMWWFSGIDEAPMRAIYGSVKLLGIYIDGIVEVRKLLLAARNRFKSAAFTSLVKTLDEHFNPEYVSKVREVLTQLASMEGITVEVGLASDASLHGFKLIKPPKKSGLRKIVSALVERKYSWSLPPRDESGARQLDLIRNLATREAARAIIKARRSTAKLVHSLRAEIAFYVAAINLWNSLRKIGVPLSFPKPHPCGKRILRFRDLVEASLALRMGKKPVGNSLDTQGRPLIFVSGPNRGGKTVFLRSIGQAQLMMMAGLFVAAESFESSITRGVFTHFSVEEKTRHGKGRLEEELARMSEIVSHINSCSLLLMNESFSSTNEAEGSEIAREIIRALIEKGVRVIYVTHFYDVQVWFQENMRDKTVFLRAERLEDGTRTYRIIPGEPRRTSHAEEIYNKVFGVGVPRPGHA